MIKELYFKEVGCVLSFNVNLKDNYSFITVELKHDLEHTAPEYMHTSYELA